MTQPTQAPTGGDSGGPGVDDNDSPAGATRGEIARVLRLEAAAMDPFAVVLTSIEDGIGRWLELGTGDNTRVAFAESAEYIYPRQVEARGATNATAVEFMVENAAGDERRAGRPYTVAMGDRLRLATDVQVFEWIDASQSVGRSSERPPFKRLVMWWLVSAVATGATISLYALADAGAHVGGYIGVGAGALAIVFGAAATIQRNIRISVRIRRAAFAYWQVARAAQVSAIYPPERADPEAQETVVGDDTPQPPEHSGSPDGRMLPH
ncbi:MULTISPECIES: hypothetical protein [unclassified Cryobacterium]|uniref:hypothetical protein n=1 Tax=unclassified Cryobacterium TaxID=2649013 RepID=UPI002AB5AA4B|nr:MULTISPECIES: hypothetical protein [unclassified Cryobacterium]MDY7542569.1 hypothetical protein [Cryobacterium sp. 5B3]MEB0264689.1 hypothetical protein [Cryobacterium sp. 10I5]MEB0273661.1 hypothetical protein [Cryobacterium sp. 5B3]